MNKKSKFKSFLLSMLPGVGHMYLGFTSRGLIFSGATLAIIFLLQFIGSGGYNGGLLNLNLLRGYRHILEFMIPVVWLVSVIDNFILTIKLNKGYFFSEPMGSQPAYSLDKTLEEQNKKLLSIMLNIIPGVGHIFLGYKDKGIQIAGSFFAMYIIGQFIGLDIFNFIAAIIWIYSILDSINIGSSCQYNGVKTELSSKDFEKASFILKNKLPLVGGFLIFLGTMVILNRFSLEFIDKDILWKIKAYVKDGLVSIIFIGLGLKLLLGKKNKLVQIDGGK
jgi:hypothetical protein